MESEGRTWTWTHEGGTKAGSRGVACQLDSSDTQEEDTLALYARLQRMSLSYGLLLGGHACLTVAEDRWLLAACLALLPGAASSAPAYLGVPACPPRPPYGSNPLRHT